MESKKSVIDEVFSEEVNPEFIKSSEEFEQQINAEKRQFEEKLNRQILTVKELKQNKKQVSKNVVLTSEEAKIFDFFKRHRDNCYTAFSFYYAFKERDYLTFMTTDLTGIERILMKMVEKGQLKGAAYKKYYFYYF